ncbi:MAG: hypothetical protein V4731_10885 [Pseudomonadota bacterium]
MYVSEHPQSRAGPLTRGRASWFTGLALCLCIAAPLAHSQGMPEDSSSAQSALLAKHTALAAQLGRNAYGRPLVIDSTEGPTSVIGNAYAVIDAPFATVNAALKSPAHWCDVMILHLNTKLCQSRTARGQPELAVKIGKKLGLALGDAYSLNFNFSLDASTPTYLNVKLASPSGPLGTHDYRIQLQATPLANGKTFVHLGYSYGYNMASRLAMQAYLATVASDKVGFSRIDTASSRGPGLVRGLRGVTERNTMRYYLAIEAYMASLQSPQQEQLERRLEAWFDATEQFPLQLREVDKPTYLALKRQEVQRQQSSS